MTEPSVNLMMRSATLRYDPAATSPDGDASAGDLAFDVGRLAAAETQDAITSILNGEASVDLPPASAYVRRVQHEMARKANLISHSYGKEPRRRVRIFRD